MEEFVLMKQSGILNSIERPILVIENNLSKEYLNPSQSSYPDIEASIEQGKDLDNIDSLFESFYVNARIVGSIDLVQYPDFTFSEAEQVQQINFFAIGEDEDLNIQEIPEQDLPSSYLSYPSADTSFEEFVYRCFTQVPEGDVHLVLNDLVFGRSPDYDLKPVKILATLFAKSDHSLICYRIHGQQSPDPRPEVFEILQNHWGSEAFRPLNFYAQPEKSRESHELSQGAVIEQVLQEVEKAKASRQFSDIFLTAPTGSGKSILFQIPAIYLARRFNYVTIVISPLKALMFDQVESLREQGIEEVAYLNSDLTLVERDEVLEQVKTGKLSILYLSPELLLSYQLDYFLGDRQLGLLVVDESHLVTTWGRDFRVDYWYLGIYLQKIRRYSTDAFPILALTATAVYGGAHDIVFETIGSLNMQLPRTFIGNIRREAIGFDIQQLTIEGSHDEGKLKQTAEIVTQFVESGTKALVYFPWTNQIRNLFVLLPPEIQRRTGKYYGSMRSDDRETVALGFKEGELLVVLATKAFGMGIDISDITHVYHHAPSGNLSDYVQEIGRVARDKSLSGLAKTDYTSKDLKYSRILFGLSSIKQWQIKEVIRKIHQMYRLKKSQTFLVSVEDFAFVFSAQDDLEQKVKSSLLLIEKDFSSRYGYPVVLTRPKSLFSTVYARFSPEVEAVLTSSYGQHMKLLKAGTPTAMPGIPMRPGMKRPDQSFSVYELDLDEIWSNHFREKSFPDAKKAFFDKALFPDVAKQVFPQMRFSIGLLQDRNSSYETFQNYLSALDWTVGKLGEGFFLRQELESALNEQLQNPRMSRRLVDLLKALYSSKKAVNRRGRITMQETDTFLQIKRKPGGEDQYRVAEASYRQVRTEIDRKFQTFFSGDKTQYEKFITTNPQKSKRTLKLAYILEVMELGTYEVHGGRLPQLFLRLNDPNKLEEATMDDGFSNLLVKQISAQHESSQKILDHFFTADLDPSARWDFVEEYFLGGELIATES
ncbi:MAG: helicase-related protein [Bacteroidota bacterium]